ncbi:uncharacterized protein LOC129597421 [Paramacrobiotus metropolitanus]|uniref:uncharacterized protein LOC129597421 n=1 Tax=Paramacrobiotus metropolitanus TaxID=2943436 RepID=UPI00244573B0|nr:uncharacterized protein LOC129597421 [Paramacrobiotus metropolitanus]
MMKHVVSKVATEEDAWIRIKVGTDDDHLAYTYTTDGKLLTKERTRSKPTADPDPKKRSSDDYESVQRYTEATSRKVTLRLFGGNGEAVETITAVIVDPITGDPVPYAPWDVSEESARNANQAAVEQLWDLIPESDRTDAVVQASTLISMMRHRAEIDGAHFRLTRRMEDGSYKTVFYDAKKNPLWEVASQGQLTETLHLEIQPPAQEGGAGETEEAQGTSANVTETGGARRSLQRVLEIAQGSHEHLQCDEPNCAHCNPPGDDEPESEDEDPPEEEGSDEKTADKHKKPLKVKPSKVKPRKAPRLEEAMNRDKVKKGDFLKKRREEEDKKKRQEEEDKKKKSGDESDSTSTGKKKRDEPASHDVEILDESVGEVEERSSTPTKSKKVIQSATAEPSKLKGKVIAVKQAVPIVISASTPKERKDKQIREKAKRETSRESEASEASLPSTSTVSARSHTDSKTTRSRTTEPRSLAEALDKGQKAKSEPVKTKGKVKTAMKVDAMAMINYAEPDGESELDFTSDEEFDGPDDDNLNTVDEIIKAYNGAEKNFIRIRTASVTSKFKSGLKTYLKKQHRSFTKQKFDVVLEFARNAGKLIQKHPSFSYEAKLFRPASSDKALTTPNEAVPMRVERAIAGMTSPLGSTSHRISQYINAVWNDGNGMIKEIDTATERVLPKLIKQNVLATTNAHKGHPIRYTRVGLIPPERQIHCNMSDSQDMEKVTVSSKTKGPMDSESESDDDATITAPSGLTTEKDEQSKGPKTSETTAEVIPKGHEASDKREKEKVMLPMDKAAAEAEADSARQVFHKSLFIPLKDVFEKERSKSVGDLKGQETLPQEEKKTAEPKSAGSSSGSLAKLRIDETATADPTDSTSSQKSSGTPAKEATDYMLGPALDVNNRTWNEVQAALQIIREKKCLGQT